ncbi:MAG: hypothetical protein COY38_05145 [Candidatus Aenigmarchaeota archaeon CG_4_10_14_0_8_um_filter_37_24]|nr:hypothetical protein [Candidatus Aenigmarchaeota archaeon]OIN88040.1 MAG: hypothetical protein AUJ50_01840 [Candidatus Aenigmarchaeota archaeon CG1_02_38_14]PIV68180.1 MAG: hypothetical protein COS07_04925 [Candidatus Aenigmarchaeota archaeon CG01_land_8_20_14_3_00_37_9]PIW41201.1 MAG: hypothetical protein COW21_03130 [Candidatus Aenigmarchaeota archaeon CG15_BIG_FIL_POST_REV_8_21_14_020_37_27]PIX50760.1 MAG: hypothetical protein COZ52_02465 [Candidatus Aenigmarchaeota archaeon CG_4_8_14_3_u
MKGQLTLEYLISFVAFIVFIVFIYLQYSSNIPSFIAEASKEDSRSKTYQLSEILLNNNGEPKDWDQSNVKRIGLSYDYGNSNQTNLLSLKKITEFNTKCSGGLNSYLSVQEILSFDQPFSVRFYEITNNGQRNIILNCAPPASIAKKTGMMTTITRITAFVDNAGVRKTGELVVEV